eukprot:11199259-Lingulodinium_polyedra.AAC.1
MADDRRATAPTRTCARAAARSARNSAPRRLQNARARMLGARRMIATGSKHARAHCAHAPLFMGNRTLLGGGSLATRKHALA